MNVKQHTKRQDSVGRRMFASAAGFFGATALVIGLTGCSGARGPAAQRADSVASANARAKKSETDARIAALEARLAAAEKRANDTATERERLARIDAQLSRIIAGLQRIEAPAAAAAEKGTAGSSGTAGSFTTNAPGGGSSSSAPATSAAPTSGQPSGSAPSMSSMQSTSSTPAPGSGTSSATPAAAAGAPVSDPSEPGPLVHRSEEVQFQGPTTEWRAMVTDLSKKFADGPQLDSASARPDLIGKALPQTRFIGPDGSIVDLADFSGRKRVVLVFMRGFAGAVCPTCSAHTIALSRSVHEFEKRNAQVILVYPGAAESIPAFLDSIKVYEAQAKLPYPVLLDVNLGAVNAFNIQGSLAKPTSIVIDQGGNVQFAYVGQRPDDRPSVKTLLAELDRIGG